MTLIGALKLSLSVSFSLKPASTASAVHHPYQIIVLNIYLNV